MGQIATVSVSPSGLWNNRFRHVMSIQLLDQRNISQNVFKPVFQKQDEILDNPLQFIIY